MNITTSFTRRSVIAASTVALAALAIVPTTAAAAAPAASASFSSVRMAQTPSDVLASTPWKTTSAFDQNGNRVALDDAAVSNFVGWAYFDADGTYTMYNLDDSPKLHGDWTVAPDGSERWINAKDAAGDVLFQRVVPITELTKNVFTYRVFPDAADTSIYYDIVHTKTNHVESGTGGRGPGANGHQGGGGDYHFNNGNAH
ncbi:hypothetical protein M2317_000596 [Microbacterium sp. ZKA21]|uniref:DUF4822 domain-containing protein n=1 Tax=Microbacterium sp. ZKA21 TaxID=3381694 RepID=UPI003D20CFE2